MAQEEKKTVCVTGGGGYQASWLIKLLLSKGYRVHATVRDPNDEKNAHLKALENASQNLQLFKAELKDYGALSTAIKGCEGVFHVAAPLLPDTVPNPEVEIMEVCVTGTVNILKVCSTEKVKKVVVVSSIAAVMFSADWQKGRPIDESCWSDDETCKLANKETWGFNWYYRAKTVAEKLALDYGKKTGLDVVTICPSGIIGPMLQPVMNGSSYLIYMLLRGVPLNTRENKVQKLVDVRDVAEALVLVYEKPEAEGRYICSSHTISTQDLFDKLRIMYPEYDQPMQFTEADEDGVLTSEKLRKLGWGYKSLEDTIVDSVRDYRERGILD